MPGTRFWGQQDLPRILRTWGSAAPDSEIAIVTVPLDQSDPDLLWRRFTDATGLPLEGIAMTSSANPSLGATSAELLRRVNPRGFASDEEVPSRLQATTGPSGAGTAGEGRAETADERQGIRQNPRARDRLTDG